jgi:hypothetical protein
MRLKIWYGYGGLARASGQPAFLGHGESREQETCKSLRGVLTFSNRDFV